MDGRQGAGIASNAGKARLTEAHLSSVSREDNDADDGDAVDEDQRADPIVEIGREDERRQRDQCDQNDQGGVFGGQLHRHTRPSTCGRTGPAA